MAGSGGGGRSVLSPNAKTALKLAHVRGVALLAIAEAAVDLGEYSRSKSR